ncbi:MAG: UDP-3-O-[3-hydroxymyristoyl] N-acetylglucosamine deacetylase, partial [Gammaproteobacteria bacterium]|nr:UDP-3-O-[3-hydroxymyristoyl] N-acetylglucosamine deacetylase [Gammaproteobacteria bacterium]
MASGGGMNNNRYQYTIRNPICAKGIGLHSGQDVVMVLRPAKPNTGIVFRRVDLKPNVKMRVSPHKIQDTQLCTALVDGKIRVSTVEHLLSALSAMQIDNILIELSAAELPIMDGSAAPFCFLLDAAGRQKQNELRQYCRILKPIRVTDGDKTAEFLPTGRDQFELDFEINFDHPVISETPCHVADVAVVFHPAHLAAADPNAVPNKPGESKADLP